MAGADVIDDRLPVRAPGACMAHHPVPQVRILHVEQFVEGLLLRFVGSVETLVQPTAEQGIELAGATAGTPAQAALSFHKIKSREAPRSPPLPCGERIVTEGNPHFGKVRGCFLRRAIIRKASSINFPASTRPSTVLRAPGLGPSLTLALRAACAAQIGNPADLSPRRGEGVMRCAAPPSAS